MTESEFVRVAPGKQARVLHVSKERFPNEAICGRPLAEGNVSPKGRQKCSHCSEIVSKRVAS